MIPWAWTLGNMWQHTLSDLRRIQDVVVYIEFERGLANVDHNA
jgi:hypothetical protein